MNAKRVIAGLTGIGVLVCAAGLWFVWKKVTQLEERGVALSLKVAPGTVERMRMETEFNELLDGEDIMSSLVGDCDLVSFYKAGSAEEAEEEARGRSRVYFHSPKRIFIVHQARRFERGENDKIGRRLGELFYEQVFESIDQTSGGGS